jgi:2-polyprenyl-3-methyl-5-hydroxy-6-metoxy-1,4-benzoquinol methylase
MISLSNEPCAVCGQTRSLLVQEATYPEHGYPGSFCLRRCTNCGLLFNSPRLDDKELKQLYGRNYYFFNRPDVREIARVVPMYARTVALVADDVREKTMLDIGCGRGYFPALLKKLGWDAHGVEISADAAKHARRLFGLEQVFTGTIERYAASEQFRTFPLVTAIDVIEHVPSPVSFVETLARVVEPGGLLIIDTPNAAAYNIAIDGPNWQGFNPFHIYLFTIPNLRTLLEAHGFVVERSFSYNNLPADHDRRPLSSRVRMKLIETARALRLIRPAASLYFKIRNVLARHGDVNVALDQAVKRARSEPSYLKTPDAEDMLARDATGDNIVVIARKK